MPINILVTGHRGYIGSALIQYLRKLSSVSLVVGYDLINGDDILDHTSLVNILKSNNIDVVIHLAALSSVTACNDNPLLAIKINAKGTLCLLNAMKEARCENIIYASTSSVYGNSNNLPYREDHMPQPCSPYGISKLLGEHVIYNHYDLKGNSGNYLIFRMFNVVGSSGFPHIDKQSNPGYDRLFSALQSGNVTIYGNNYPTIDGTCERDYVALKDVCHAYIKGIYKILSTNNLRSTINICSGFSDSVKWIITRWNDIRRSIKYKTSGYEYCHKLPYVKYTYGPRRQGDPSKVYGSNKKAIEVISWEAKRKIDDIIFDLSIDKKF